jgi:hypothetical protein
VRAGRRSPARALWTWAGSLASATGIIAELNAALPTQASLSVGTGAPPVSPSSVADAPVVDGSEPLSLPGSAT